MCEQVSHVLCHFMFTAASLQVWYEFYDLVCQTTSTLSLKPRLSEKQKGRVAKEKTYIS
jgi:hypothetical protein